MSVRVDSVRAIAGSIDHALLQPTLTNREFDVGCELASDWLVAAVCVKSIDVRRARARILGSEVAICAVVGFPHANAPTEVTCNEIKRALDDGATEIDAVVSLGPVLDSEWTSVSEQIHAFRTASAGATLKVIFETGLIPERQSKIKLCHICRDLGVGYVKTSTGFAYGRDAGGRPVQLGATLEDIRLMVEHAGPACKAKASGGIRTFDECVQYLNAGAARLGTASTAAILGEASQRLSPA